MGKITIPEPTSRVSRKDSSELVLRWNEEKDNLRVISKTVVSQSITMDVKIGNRATAQHVLPLDSDGKGTIAFTKGNLEYTYKVRVNDSDAGLFQNPMSIAFQL